jgi:hypothetical protein
VSFLKEMLKDLCQHNNIYLFIRKGSNMYIASHKSNPSSIPQGYVDLYSALPWVTWEAVKVVEGISC